MNDKMREELLEMERLVHAQHEDGTITDDEYCKCLVSLSYEYFHDDDLGGGLLLLGLCSKDYFRKTQLEHMRADPTYQAMVVFIASRLVEKGVASLYDVPAPTQAPAKA
jgi:hypothetical protein